MRDAADAAIILARDAAVILGFVAGGVVGAGMGGAASFFGLFYLLRFVCWVAGKDDYMFFMWSSLLIVPLFAIMSFVFGGGLVVIFAREWVRRRQSAAFEVVAKSAREHAG